MKRGPTPAIEMAERAGVAIRVHSFDHDPEAKSYGMEAAAALGVEAARVFKTLVASVDGASWAVAIVPAEARLNLKALAAAAGGKKAELAEPARAESLTGYVVGGISPLGQRRSLPTFVDESARKFDTIFVSAGRRGLDLEIAPADLIALTTARAAALT